MNQIYIKQMIYPIIGSLLSGALSFYVAYTTHDSSPIDSGQVIQVSKDTFHADTITHYVERTKEKNKYIIYSKLHKCPLSTHQYIDSAVIKALEQVPAQSAKENQKPITKEQQIAVVVVAQENKVIESVLQQETETYQNNIRKASYNIFKNYGNQLINKGICSSVELIYGPIFSKDTPYKPTKEQTIKSVFVSNIKMSKEGEYLTDRNYTIVVCNSQTGTFYNGFSYRRLHNNKLRLLNYITSLKKLQQQTGLVFDLSGKPLITHDYQGISKQRDIPLI